MFLLDIVRKAGKFLLGLPIVRPLVWVARRFLGRRPSERVAVTPAEATVAPVIARLSPRLVMISVSCVAAYFGLQAFFRSRRGAVILNRMSVWLNSHLLYRVQRDPLLQYEIGDDLLKDTGWRPRNPTTFLRKLSDSDPGHDGY